MKLRTTPEKLKLILKSGMIHHKKPLINPVPIKFGEEGASITAMYRGIAGVEMFIPKESFLEYDAKNETFLLPLEVYERLSWGFKTGDVSVLTEKSKVTVKGESDTFGPIDTEHGDMEKLPFKTIKTEQGIIPEKLSPPPTAVIINAKHLQSLFSKVLGPEYTFKTDGKTLSAVFDNGRFHRELPCEIVGREPCEVLLDSEHMASIVNNLEGDIFFILNEKMVVLTQNTDGFIKTYLLASMVSAED